jgi:hypothetical protein
MIGVTLARQGAGHVRGVVEGSGPISLPLAFIPFQLQGQRLGNVSRVIVLRDAPKQVSAVELQVKLRDSVIARGLEGCRLAANFDADQEPQGERVRGGHAFPGVFSCVQAGDSALGFQEFGRAVFQPGNVSVPLLLPNDMVNDLKAGDLGEQPDSVEQAAEAVAESISAEAEALADSIATTAETRADSIEAHSRHLIDSLREEGLRRADSARRATR